MQPLTWRQQELAEYGSAIRWLSPVAASEAYGAAERFDNPNDYGLNPERVDGIENSAANRDEAAVSAWLTERFRDAEAVRVVFGESDVAVVSAAFIVAEWPNLFAPSRDDAILVAESGEWVAFYSHEDVWEWGRPKPTAA